MRVLIAGCGYVGTAVAEKLLAKGWFVVAIRRSTGAPLPGVQWLSLDLVNGNLLPDVGPIDAVVYALAADEYSEEAYERAYVRGVKNLLALAKGVMASSRPFIFASSTAVYGQDDGSWVDEESETTPRGFNGRLLLEGERLVLESSYRGIVVRFGGIYGPLRVRMIDRVWSGKEGQGEASGYINLIHRDDCAGVIDHLIHSSHKDDTYVGVDCEPVARGELNRWIAGHLGVARGNTGEVASGHLNKRCSNERLVKSGYQFLYPSFREGLLPLLQEFRKTHK